MHVLEEESIVAMDARIVRLDCRVLSDTRARNDYATDLTDAVTTLRYSW